MGHANRCDDHRCTAWTNRSRTSTPSRVQTRLQISQLQRRLGVTTLYVTHDQVEAMTMGDRIAVLEAGVLQQSAAPNELYNRPINTFVAGFIGSPAMNMFNVELAGSSVEIGGYTVPLMRTTTNAGISHALIGIRPEHFQIVAANAGIPITVDAVEHLGSDLHVYGHIPGSTQQTIVRGVPEATVLVGSTVYVLPLANRIHIFTSDGTRRI